MTDNSASKRSLSERLEDIELIQRALTQAVKEALRHHKLAGHSIAASRDGRVVWIEPENIPLEHER